MVSNNGETLSKTTKTSRGRSTKSKIKIGILVAVVVVLVVAGLIFGGIFIYSYIWRFIPDRYELIEINFFAYGETPRMTITLTLNPEHPNKDPKRQWIGLEITSDYTCIPFAKPVTIPEFPKAEGEEKVKIVVEATLPPHYEQVFFRHLELGKQQGIKMGYILSPDNKDKEMIFKTKANIKNAGQDFEKADEGIKDIVVKLDQYKFDHPVDSFEAKIGLGWTILFISQDESCDISTYLQTFHGYFLKDEPDKELEVCFYLHRENWARITVYGQGFRHENFNIPLTQLQSLIKGEKSKFKTYDRMNLKEHIKDILYEFLEG